MAGKYRLAALALAAALVCAGCQPTPETSAVTSKNDGAFEAALENQDGTKSAGVAGETAAYQTTFTSADGSITYSADVEIPAAAGAVPVIQVTPHEITPEQAQSVASVLFDGAEMYEYSEEMSKSELEEAILSIRQELSDYDAMLEYYSGNTETTDYMVSVYENRLERYEAAYDEADETVQPQPCEWTFYPETHYYDEAGEEDNLCIMATAIVDGWPYQFSACNRNEEDYRIHEIWAYPDMLQITEDEIYGGWLTEPDSEEVESYCAKAETMLDEMGLSDWLVDSCEVYDHGLNNGQSSYVIRIQATPVYEGIPVTRQEQIMSVKSGDEYASNYYYETIRFEFCGGRLVAFEYQAPLEEVGVVNSDVQILSVDEIVGIFEDQMKLDDITAYQSELSEEAEEEGFQVKEAEVSVTDAEFGLARIRIQNNATDFYLVPAYTFRGVRTYVYENGQKETDEEETLAVINAVDGSIISASLGY